METPKIKDKKSESVPRALTISFPESQKACYYNSQASSQISYTGKVPALSPRTKHRRKLFKGPEQEGEKALLN